MKGTRLADVLDDKLVDKTFWNKMFSKLVLLVDKIEATNPSIDDTDLRWCTDRLERWDSEERVLTKDEMKVANNLWNKYNGKKLYINNNK